MFILVFTLCLYLYLHYVYTCIYTICIPVFTLCLYLYLHYVYTYIYTMFIPVFTLCLYLFLHYVTCCVYNRSALCTMSVGYSSKNLRYPISKLTSLLLTNTDTDTQRLCENLGVTVDGEHVCFLKTTIQPDTKVTCTLCICPLYHKDCVDQCLH